MAKISSFQHTVVQGAKWEVITIEIHYSPKREAFYSKVPEKVIHLLESMGDKTAYEQYKITKDRLKGGYQDHGTWVFWGKTEADVRHSIIGIVDKLASLEVVTVNVILIHYKPADEVGSHYIQQYNKGMDPIGMQMGVTYAEKTGLPGGDSTYKVQGWNWPKFKKEYRNKWIEIPDTPEARAALEKLYGKLRDLCESLHGFMKNEQTVFENIIGTQFQIEAPKSLSNEETE